MKPLSRKPKRKPVTLIAGIICQDGIVVAADSQTSWDTGKRYDANKMTDVHYCFGRALVAQAGTVITSQALIEEIWKLTEKSDRFEFPSLAGIVSQAARKVRDKLRFQHFDCSAEEFQNILREEELDCALMIADYSGKQARIDTVSLSVGIPAKAQSYFETIGSGSDLATMLLTDLCTPDMKTDVAAVIAVHVVELVKNNDPYCGGPTRLGIVKKPAEKVFDAATIPVPEDETGISGYKPNLFAAYAAFLSSDYVAPIIMSQTHTDEIAKIAAEVESATKQKRREIIFEALAKRAVNERMKELFANPEDLYSDDIGEPKVTPEPGD